MCSIHGKMEYKYKQRWSLHKQRVSLLSGKRNEENCQEHEEKNHHQHQSLMLFCISVLTVVSAVVLICPYNHATEKKSRVKEKGYNKRLYFCWEKAVVPVYPQRIYMYRGTLSEKQGWCDGVWFCPSNADVWRAGRKDRIELRQDTM